VLVFPLPELEARGYAISRDDCSFFLFAVVVFVVVVVRIPQDGNRKESFDFRRGIVELNCLDLQGKVFDWHPAATLGRAVLVLYSFETVRSHALGLGS